MTFKEPEDEEFERIAQKQIADLKKSSKAIVEDAAVRAVHKVMAEFDAPLTLNGVALYPKLEWQGLTDEEILALARDHYNPHQRSEISFARAIEAKLRSKNENI